MGAGASANKGGAEAASAAAGRASHSREATNPKHSPAYRVKGLSANLADLPHEMLLRVDPEALQLVTVETEAVLKSYPYHEIPCWGHSRDSFQFRAFSAGRGSEVETVQVRTNKGHELEKVIMDTVKELMRNMKDKGIPEESFRQLMAVLDADGDQAIAAIRQVATTREFDVKQASKVVNKIGVLSPFDKIEVAVLMYPTLINKDSFTLVLKEFEEEADRSNICHRLSISVQEDGTIVEHGKRNSARAKPSDSVS